jgi:hypothetical protein
VQHQVFKVIAFLNWLGHNREAIFTCVYIKENLFKLKYFQKPLQQQISDSQLPIAVKNKVL